MERRTFIRLLVAPPAAAAVAAACGSGSNGTGDAGTLPTPDSDAASSTEPAVSVPPTTDGSVEPDDADVPADVVLEWGVYGGFTTRQIAFEMQPMLYVTSDGRAITPGVETMIYPGALVPANSVRSITQEGIDALLAAAEEAGMFAEVDYDADSMIADAGTTTLRIKADGEEYLHEAYALGFGGLSGPEGQVTPERQNLADFLEQLTDLPGLVGESELGPVEVFDATAYQFVADPIADVSAFEIAPTVVPWPGDTGVALADAVSCVEVERAVVGDLFETADELTFFGDAGVTYQLAVRPVFPGRDC